ncbi:MULTISPECIES: maleylacetate reductase [unclassified Pseudomonas]|uniref:maleylacetate reductase n=1 Tax=unclassified Pseudomonas TaxID=196821 RepID=UPI002456D0F0|nr:MULTISPECIES: maleylacetate reductase [unclassified Pseudomonas]MDH4561324.1 maleylacetate reductase [Pseudomonas sp. BN411]MDH4656984.1 maleylacetate reductase [Pseudomonas sp. BN606]
MQPFSYNALPARVIFGFDTLRQVAEEVQLLGCKRALVLSTPHQKAEAQHLSNSLGELSVGTFTEATMHTPVEVTARAVEHVKRLDADCVIALGGGSTIGLGKAIALNTDLPQIAIPTTYAGSEATPILGQTEKGIKTTQRTLKVLPEVIIYDVELTLTLPAQLTVTSGLNAIAHAVEALYSKDANPLISMLAEQGIAAIARAIPRIHANPNDREARSDALFGAWACGTCLGAVGMSLHHKLCHTLGGSFDLPHAETHTVVLPHAVAYNASAAPEAIARVARALGVDDAAKGLYDLATKHGAPKSLADIGLRREDVARAADIACASPYWNPRTIERASIGELLENAFLGIRPNSN